MHLVDITGIDKGKGLLAIELKAFIHGHKRENRVEVLLEKVQARIQDRHVGIAHLYRKEIVDFFKKIFNKGKHNIRYRIRGSRSLRWFIFYRVSKGLSI